MCSLEIAVHVCLFVFLKKAVSELGGFEKIMHRFFKHHKTFTHTELFSNLSNESRATVFEKSWHFVELLQNTSCITC